MVVVRDRHTEVSMMVTDHDHHTTVTKHRFPPLPSSQAFLVNIGQHNDKRPCQRDNCCLWMRVHRAIVRSHSVHRAIQRVAMLYK